MNFLETEDVVKQYANHLALDKVSIQVPEGKVFGLLGPNGAGKTTLIRIINRITAPDSGLVRFNGREFQPEDIYQIGYLPEERGLYKKMKVGEQAIYLAQLKGLSYQEARIRLIRWFEKFDIMPWWNKKVEELSGGRIAYVHIKGMDSPSFRKIYSELLGRYRNKEAVVVDTRHNGGGWLHDDVVTLLSGKEYQRFVPRGQYIGSDPFNKWLKASCMLTCEDNYSNAHGTPYVYKTLGIGKLVGAPVAGTMTAVWWERQIDPSIVFGIPQVGCMDMQGNYLENQTLQPDILVYNEPAASLKGEDAQLKAAVDYLLKDLSKKK